MRKIIFYTTLLLIVLLIAITAQSLADGVSGDTGTVPQGSLSRADLGRTGVYDDGGIRPVNALFWSYTTGGSVYSSPAIANGVVYEGSDDGRVYAFDAVTGELRWGFATEDCVESSPTVANGVVYVGSDDGNVYAIFANNGSLFWRFKTDDCVRSSPAVANGVVYVGSEDGNVYALNADDGSQIWSYATGDYVYSSPAMANGIVYIASDNNLYALDAQDGGFIWSDDIEYIDSAPAVADGVVYVQDDCGSVFALNAATGEQLWCAPSDDETETGLAVADGAVYGVNDSGYIFAFDAGTGEEIWCTYMDSSMDSTPSVANGIVYAGSEDGNLYAFDAASGQELWNFETGWAIVTSPAIANGVVYVGSEDDKIYAIGAPPMAPSAPEVPGAKYRSFLNNTGVYDDGGIRPASSTLWTSKTGGFIESTPVIADGRIFTGSGDGHLYSLDAKTGFNQWTFNTGSGFQTTPAAANGVIYISGHYGTVYAVDENTGRQLWSNHIDEASSSSPAVYNGVIYVGGMGSLHALYADTGVEKWSYSAYKDVSSPAVANGIVYFTNGRGDAFAAFAVNGTTLWTNHIGSSISSPAVADGLVFAANDSYVFALDAATGQEIWCYYTGTTQVSSPAVANGVVYAMHYGDAGTDIIALDASSGQVIWSKVPGQWNSYALSVANGRVYAGSNDHNVYVLDASSGNQLWTYAAGDSIYSAPAIVSGTVYVGCEDGYIYAIGQNNKPPTVKVVSPVNGAVNISTGRIITATFDKDIDPATLSGFTLRDSKNVPVPGTVTIKNKVATFTPTNLLARNTTFTAKLAASISDTGGHPLGADYMWSFTTAQLEPMVLWSYQTTGASTPTLVGGIIYAGDSQGNVYAVFASNGTKLWSSPVGGSSIAAPTVANGVVYSSGGFNVSALDANTGACLWNFTALGYIYTSPAVANGRVFVTSGYNLGDKLYALDASNGHLLWSYTITPYSNNEYSSPVVVNGIVYVGSNYGYMYAIFANNGTLLWKFYATSLIFSSPAVIDSMVFFGGGDGYVYAVNAITGRQVWRTKPGDGYSGIYSMPVVADGKVFTSDGSHNVYVLDENSGSVLWHYQTDIQSRDLAYENGIVYAAGGVDNNVSALDATTGQLLWNYQFSGGWPTTSPAVANGVVFQASDDGKINAIGTMISSMSLPNGTTGVLPTAPGISVNFQVGMDASTLASGFKLYDSNVNPVSGAVSYDPISGTATFTPAGPLAPGTTYTAVLSSAVKDAAGYALGPDYSWSFATMPDTTPPVTACTLTGSAGSNGWNTSAVTVDLDATDSGSGVASISYQLDSYTGSWTTTTGSHASLTISIEGMHTLYYYSVDNAGNHESLMAKSIKIDTSKPVVSYTIGGSYNADLGGYMAPLDIYVTGTDSVSGVARSFAQIRGIDPMTRMPTWHDYGDEHIQLTSPGDYTLRFASTDYAGNTNYMDAVTITVKVPVDDSQIAGIDYPPNMFANTAQSTHYKVNVTVKNTGQTTWHYTSGSGVTTYDLAVSDDYYYQPDLLESMGVTVARNKTDVMPGECVLYTFDINPYYISDPASADTVHNLQFKMLASSSPLAYFGQAGQASIHVLQPSKPFVVSVTPANGAGDVARTALVNATLNVNPDPGASYIEVRDAGGNPVAGHSSCTGNNVSFALNPGVYYSAGKTYTATVYAMYHDYSLPAPFSWSFAADPKGSWITSQYCWFIDHQVMKVIGNASVPLNTRISLVFDRYVDIWTVNSNTVQLINGYTDGTVPCTFYFYQYDNGTSRVDIQPNDNLTGSTPYSLVVNAPMKNGNPGIKDNKSAAMGCYETYGFRTCMAVQSLSPASGAVNAPVTTSISATFGQTIDYNTYASAVTVKDSNNNPIPGTSSFSDKVLTFVPKSALAGNTTYTVTISGLKDIWGDEMAAPYAWSFTTEDMPPYVIATTPLQGAEYVSPALSCITATFNEEVDISTLMSGFKLEFLGNNTVLPGTITYSNRVATFTPSVKLTGNMYVARLIGIKDLAGKTIGDATWPQYYWTFSVGSDTSPHAVGCTPSNGTAGVSTMPNIYVYFDKPLDGSVLHDSSTSFCVVNSSNHVTGCSIVYLDQGSGLDDGSVSTVIATPTSSLWPNDTYRLEVKDVAGADGYSTWGTYRSFFSTGAPSFVVGSEPSSGETGWPVAPLMEVYFARQLDPSSLNGHVVLRDSENNVVPLDITYHGSPGFIQGSASYIVAAPSDFSLMENETYTLAVTGVKDTQGMVMADTYRTWFVTQPGLKITDISPKNGKIGQPYWNYFPTVHFNWHLDTSALDGHFILRDGRGNVVPVNLNYGVDDPYGNNGMSSYVTVTPKSGALDMLTRYTLEVSGVRAYDDTLMKGTNGTTFCTSGGGGYITMISPMGGDVNVPVTSPIVVDFTWGLDSSSVLNGFTLTDQSGNNVPGTVSYSASYPNYVATFTPTAPLTDGSMYGAHLAGIKDDAGTAMQAYSWGFTTAYPPPHVLSVSPAAGTTNQPTSITVSAKLSEYTDASMLAGRFTLRDQANNLVAGSVGYDSATKTVTFTPSRPLLANGGTYMASLRGITGQHDNVMPDYAWTFSTLLRQPGIVAAYPTEAEGDVEPNDTLWARFSEDMNPATVQAGFRLYDETQKQWVPGTISYSNRNATFKPNSPLIHGDKYTVSLQSLTGLEQNLMPTYYVTFWVVGGASGGGSGVIATETPHYYPTPSPTPSPVAPIVKALLDRGVTVNGNAITGPEGSDLSRVFPNKLVTIPAGDGSLTVDIGTSEGSNLASITGVHIGDVSQGTLGGAPATISATADLNSVPAGSVSFSALVSTPTAAQINEASGWLSGQGGRSIVGTPLAVIDVEKSGVSNADLVAGSAKFTLTMNKPAGFSPTKHYTVIRHSDSGYEELPATVKSYDATTVTFEIASPHGFSTFIIAETTVITTPTATVQPPASVTPVPGPSFLLIGLTVLAGAMIGMRIRKK